jgi:Uncharacterised nucleotidyltransferase
MFSTILHKVSLKGNRISSSHPISENLVLLKILSPHHQPHSTQDFLQANPGTLDWQALINAAVQHRVFPQFYLALTEHAPEDISPQLLSQLRHLYNQNALRTIALTGELFRTLDTLEQANIPTIAFKGPTLSLIAYGSLSARSFDDLDILVKPQDFFKPKTVLESFGYDAHLMPILSEQQEREFFWRLGEYTLHHPETEIHIDVHGRAIAGDGFAYTTDMSRFWDRSSPIDLLGRSIPTFKREDLLLYLCMGAAKDCYPHLKGICDIAALIHNHPDLDWDFIMQESRDLKLDRVLRVGLLLVHELLAIPLTDRLLKFAQADRKALWLKKIVATRLTQSRSILSREPSWERFIIRFLSLGHWEPQLHHGLDFIKRIFRLLFMVNKLDYSFFPLPHRLYFLYYLIRPARLLQKHRSGLLKVIFR